MYLSNVTAPTYHPLGDVLIFNMLFHSNLLQHRKNFSSCNWINKPLSNVPNREEENSCRMNDSLMQSLRIVILEMEKFSRKVSIVRKMKRTQY